MVAGAHRVTGTIPHPWRRSIKPKNSSSNTTEAAGQAPAKKRRNLSAEKKFQIYLEAQSSDQPINELLRWESSHCRGGKTRKSPARPAG